MQPSGAANITASLPESRPIAAALAGKGLGKRPKKRPLDPKYLPMDTTFHLNSTSSHFPYTTFIFPIISKGLLMKVCSRFC
jgi:hypothetical protein